MTAVAILLAVLFAAGLVLRLTHRPEPEDAAEVPEAGSGECCGMHVACEKDSLLASVSREIEYFSDEELDAYAGRGADDYDAAEADEFRDVLLTLRPAEIAPWARSLQLRGITLPADVRDELLLVVSEARAQAAVAP